MRGENPCDRRLRSRALCDHVSVPADQSCRVWWAGPVDPESAPGLVALLDGHERDRLTRLPPRPRPGPLPGRARPDPAGARAAGRPAPGGAGVRPHAAAAASQHGKPTAARAGPEFSFTHGGDLVGVAVRSGRRAGRARRRTGPRAVRPGRDGRPRRLPGRAGRRPAALDGFFATVDPQGGPAQGDRRRPLRPRWPRSPSGRAASPPGPGTGAPAGPVWLRDLAPAPGYRAAVAGLGRPPGVVVEHDGPGRCSTRLRG